MQKALGMVFGMYLLSLGCVLDKNKTPFLGYLRDFACLLLKLIFKNILLIDFQLYNPKLQANEKFHMAAFQFGMRKTIHYVMKLNYFSL